MEHKIRDLGFELKDAYGQFYRYGELESPLIMDIIWTLTDINDDMAHDRSERCLIENIERAKSLLDELLSTVHG